MAQVMECLSSTIPWVQTPLPQKKKKPKKTKQNKETPQNLTVFMRPIVSWNGETVLMASKKCVYFNKVYRRYHLSASQAASEWELTGVQYGKNAIFYYVY
jgi:hypothetical protein